MLDRRLAPALAPSPLVEALVAALREVEARERAAAEQRRATMRVVAREEDPDVNR